jgi:hypothetical protein
MMTKHNPANRDRRRRRCWPAIVALAALAAGCATGERRHDPARAGQVSGPAVIESAEFAAAVPRIVAVNAEHRFVVIDYRSRSLPPIGAQLGVHRGGTRVGTLRVSEPSRSRLGTADILEGDPRVGDEVR